MGKLSEHIRGVLDYVNPEFALLRAMFSGVGKVTCFFSLSEVSTGLVALFSHLITLSGHNLTIDKVVFITMNHFLLYNF